VTREANMARLVVEAQGTVTRGGDHGQTVLAVLVD
jgi:hypothetical protein